jgi:hypothetical protein
VCGAASAAGRSTAAVDATVIRLLRDGCPRCSCQRSAPENVRNLLNGADFGGRQQRDAAGEAHARKASLAYAGRMIRSTGRPPTFSSGK